MANNTGFLCVNMTFCFKIKFLAFTVNRCKENKLVKKGACYKESGARYGKILKNDVKNYLSLENNVLV